MENKSKMEILFEIAKKGAEGAFPNETRVKKISVEEGDHHKIGSIGTVRGSIKPASMNIYGYFVQFDNDMENITFIISSKIEEVKDDKQRMDS